MDTCSTDKVFCNRKLLTDVRNCESGEKLSLITNGGISHYDQIGNFDTFSTDVHFNPNSIANVLSFSKLAQNPGVHITADTASCSTLDVHAGSDVYRFQPCHDGLYYIDAKDLKKNKTKSQVNNYSESCP